MKQNVDNLQAPPDVRDEALRRFAGQMAAWGLTAPEVEPLVLDFGLGDFERTGLIECWIANETQAGYCGKYMFVFAGQTCPLHSHCEKHETFFVVKGCVRITSDARPRELRAGGVLPVPPGEQHSFTGVEASLLLELSTPCDVSDNAFADANVREWLNRNVKGPDAT